MTEAQKAGKLSAPQEERSSEKAPVDALPENGRVRSRGRSSLGTPIRSVNGEIRPSRKSSTPEAESILTAARTATREGRSVMAQSSPSFAPERKWSKLTFFEKSRINAVTATARGILSAASLSTVSIFFSEYLSAGTAETKGKKSATA